MAHKKRLASAKLENIISAEIEKSMTQLKRDLKKKVGTWTTKSWRWGKHPTKGAWTELSP